MSQQSGSDHKERTFGDWLWATDVQQQPHDHYRWARLQRLHSVQVALDTLAHIQNVPLRIFRVNALKELPQTLCKLIKDHRGSVIELFDQSHLSDDDQKAFVALTDEPARMERELVRLRRWVLALADQSNGLATDHKNRGAPTNMALFRALLILQPHIEQAIWVVDMANPLPLHAIARMSDPWALYVLMWTWDQAMGLTTANDHTEPQKFGESILNCPGWSLWVSPTFVRPGLSESKESQPQELRMIVGPLRTHHPAHPRNHGDSCVYIKQFRALIKAWTTIGAEIGSGRKRSSQQEFWREAEEKAPTDQELTDARDARGMLSPAEAQHRANRCWKAWCQILKVRLCHAVPTSQAADLCVDPSGFSRANVETLALLVAWYCRWDVALNHPAVGALPPLAVEQHRLVLGVRRERFGETPVLTAELLHDLEGKPLESFQRAERMRGDLAKVVKLAQDAADWRWIEMPEVLLSRMRERQSVGHSTQVMAINNLLLRHSRSDVDWPGDAVEEAGQPPGGRNNHPHPADDADHLLRGFGGRVCRHLMTMARADLAFVYWLDYSQPRPRLVGAGSYMRLIQHHALRHKIASDFHEHFWKEGPPLARSAKGWLSKDMQGSQLYRVAASGRYEHKWVTPDRSADEDFLQFEEAYQSAPPLPNSAITLPLTVNGRVVGVVSVAGVAGHKQFDTRQLAPLRRSAQLLAHALYSQSQLWQMRKLNWLAANRPLEQWKDTDRAGPHGPLGVIAQTLSNIFLCPVVHIWMRSKRHEHPLVLQGCTWPALFGTQGREAARPTMPTSTAQAIERDTAVPLHHPWVDFAWQLALAQAKPTQSRSVGQHSQNESGGEHLAHSFVTAVYRHDAQRTVGYDWRSAQRGQTVLGRDWIEANDNDGRSDGDKAYVNARRRIFGPYDKEMKEGGWGLNAVMSFALADPGAAGDARLHQVGALSFHAYAETTEDVDEDLQLCTGALEPGWSAGWEPVVRHMQAYLPYVFRQVELIANPLNQMRTYFLHEGRRLLIAARNHAQRSQAEVAALTNVQGGWRKRLADATRPLAQRGPLDEAQKDQLQRALEIGLQHLEALQAHHNSTVSQTLMDEMAQLQRFLLMAADFPSLAQSLPELGLRGLSLEWVSLDEDLLSLLRTHQHRLREKGCGWGVDVPDGVKVLAAPDLLRWLLSGLCLNAAKYAARHSELNMRLVRARWTSAESDVFAQSGGEGYALVMSNTARFDPDEDQWPRLAALGSRGGAARALGDADGRDTELQGQGLGLWGARRLAPVMQLRLGCRIEPIPRPVETSDDATPSWARYHFALCFASTLVDRKNQERKSFQYDDVEEFEI